MPVIHMVEKILVDNERFDFALCWSLTGKILITQDASEVTCPKCLKLLAKRTAEALGPPLTRAQILNRVRTALRPLEAPHRDTPDKLVQEARLVALKELRACLPKDMEPDVKITYEPFSSALNASVTWGPKR